MSDSQHPPSFPPNAYQTTEEPISPQGGFSAYVPAQPPIPPQVQENKVPPRRRTPLLFFLLIFLIGLLLIPWLAEQIAYSINRGKERAKADVARKLLAEIPDAEQRISWVAKLVAPSIVGIRTFSTGPRGTGMDVGSGVIVGVEGNTGFILTNNHVVAHAQYIVIQMNDGRDVDAHLIGRDRDTDLAVLRIEESNLEAIGWGNSSRIEVGDQVIAVGNPYALGQTVTSGIISATERFNPLPSGSRVQEFLQTDAAINPGNSGGPLVDLKGELIGINTAIFSETGGNMGIGFAIPSILARRVYEDIRKHGEVQHGWLGISMRPTNQRDVREMNLDKPHGAVVVDFFPDSPAREAGVEKQDIIVRWGETEIRDPLHLSHLIVLAKPDKVETIEVVRDGKRLKLEVRLGIRPVELR